MDLPPYGNTEKKMSEYLALAQMKQCLDAAQKRVEEAEKLADAAEKRAAAAEKRTAAAEKLAQNPEGSKILKDINQLRKIEKANGRELYYPNQEATAKEVCESITNVAIVFMMVLAVCQAGKTGCMLAIIEQLLMSNSQVNPENIFVITGLSDTEWVAQTRRRIPLLVSNVIHRGQFKRYTSIFKNLKNAVIIIDECHVASEEGMTPDKLLAETGLKDIKYLKDNNINILEFSATPKSTLADFELWETCSKVHIMNPGRGYKGHGTMISDNRLYQAEDLFIADDPAAGLSDEQEKKRYEKIEPAFDAIRKIKSVIEHSYNYPRHHIIRTPTAKKADTVIGRFKQIFESEYNYKKCYGGEDQLMEELGKCPEKHTFLFIKETARCAMTFGNKDRIGILYERLPKSNLNHDVIVQGLAGRACGYDVDDGMIVYSNVDSIEQYCTVVASNFKVRDGYDSKNNKPSYLNPMTTKYPWKNTEDEVGLDAAKPVVTDKMSDRAHLILDTEEQANSEYHKLTGLHRKKSNKKAPVCLRGGDQDGANPTIDYILTRWWGLHGKIPARLYPTYDGKWCLYWRPSLILAKAK